MGLFALLEPQVLSLLSAAACSCGFDFPGGPNLPRNCRTQDDDILSRNRDLYQLAGLRCKLEGGCDLVIYFTVLFVRR